MLLSSLYSGLKGLLLLSPGTGGEVVRLQGLVPASCTGNVSAEIGRSFSDQFCGLSARGLALLKDTNCFPSCTPSGETKLNTESFFRLGHFSFSHVHVGALKMAPCCVLAGVLRQDIEEPVLVSTGENTCVAALCSCVASFVLEVFLCATKALFLLDVGMDLVTLCLFN